jgi:hypothetical protein
VKLKETVPLLVTAKGTRRNENTLKTAGIRDPSLWWPAERHSHRALFFPNMDTDASEPNFVSHTQSRLPTLITPSSIQRDSRSKPSYLRLVKGVIEPKRKMSDPTGRFFSNFNNRVPHTKTPERLDSFGLPRTGKMSRDKSKSLTRHHLLHYSKCVS